MGVYIKGMEMPKNCCACPLFKSNMSKQLFCKAFDAFDKSDYDKLPIERMKNCPLVEVKTPHGRLVDAGVLLRYKGDCYDADGHLLYAVGTGSIMCASTVIEAEGKDDG